MPDRTKVSQHLKPPTGQYTVYNCLANSSDTFYLCLQHLIATMNVL